MGSHLATKAQSMASVLPPLPGHGTQASEPMSIRAGAFTASVDAGRRSLALRWLRFLAPRPGGLIWGGRPAGLCPHGHCVREALGLSRPPLGRCPAFSFRTVLMQRCLFSCDVSSLVSRPCFSWCLSCRLQLPRGAGTTRPGDMRQGCERRGTGQPSFL